MRYLPLSETDRAQMLDAVGVASQDALFDQIPASAKPGGLLLAPGLSEMAVERHLNQLAAKNLNGGQAPSFLGAGSYRHHIPAAVDQLLMRGEFLTAYTPYQPEIAQGTLQMLFEFQSQVAEITGMEVANASMYDGATACAEAVAMAARVTKRNRVLISGTVHPHWAETTRTLVEPMGIDVECLDPDVLGMEDLLGRVDEGMAAIVVQNPGFFGGLKDLRSLAAIAHELGMLLIVAVTEPVSLGLIESPGAMGADIVAVDGQSLGIGPSFGGPGLGLLATREKYLRQMPGRVCGQTIDKDGKTGYVLTLSTREQHIRREKATSNICTNSGLCALAFSIHLALLGGSGFNALAQLNHARAVELERKLTKLPAVRVLSESYFNEFALYLGDDVDAADVVDRLADKSILAGVPASRLYPHYPELRPILLVTATELTEPEDMDRLVTGLTEALA